MIVRSVRPVPKPMAVSVPLLETPTILPASTPGRGWEWPRRASASRRCSSEREARSPWPCSCFWPWPSAAVFRSGVRCRTSPCGACRAESCACPCSSDAFRDRADASFRGVCQNAAGSSGEAPRPRPSCRSDVPRLISGFNGSGNGEKPSHRTAGVSLAGETARILPSRPRWPARDAVRCAVLSSSTACPASSARTEPSGLSRSSGCPTEESTESEE